MDFKNEQIKNKINELIRNSKSELKISRFLKIPLGRTFRDKYSVKWYLRCIQLKGIASSGGRACHKKYPDLNKRLVRIMHVKTNVRKEKDSSFAAYMHKKAVERGNITLNKHPLHFKKMSKISSENIKRYRFIKEYDEIYCASRIAGAKKGGKFAGPLNVKIMRKSLTNEILSKAGKKGGPLGGKKTVEIFRKRKNIKFRKVCYDSIMELECAKLFIKHGVVNEFVEGYNCHIKIGTKDFDFFPQRKIFVEFHPLRIFDQDETYESYFKSRRVSLDNAGYGDYPLVVLTNLDDFQKKTLPYFRNK